MSKSQFDKLSQLAHIIYDLRVENKTQKLKFQLFIGKVADEIGIDRTSELLSEVKEAFNGSTKQD